jgi:hypothetical protein
VNGTTVSARVEQARPTYRVVVRRANDLPREDVRQPGALWLLAKGVAAASFVLRRGRRRWRVELRQGSSLVFRREVEHVAAARVLAAAWRRELAAGTRLDDLP